MARRRRASSGSMFAWSDLHAGGEVEFRDAPGGRKIKVVMNRTIIPRGDKVSRSDLDVTDEQWDALIANGSIRPYDLPEGSDEWTSPTQAFVNNIMNDRGEPDINVMMELALAHPPAINPPAEEAAEVPEGV